jgi:hypothetical protein
MEIAESAAGLLIYKELDYSCIHGGKNCSGTIQKEQTCVFYHMTYDSIVMT